MKWEDDLLLEHSPHMRGMVQLACYAVYLASGGSIRCQQLRVNTIKQYLLAVASFLMLFSGVDYRKEADNQGSTHMGPILGSVYRDLERLETIAKKRDPYTIPMHLEARRVATPYRLSDPLTKLPTLVDEFEKALLHGNRLSEWA